MMAPKWLLPALAIVAAVAVGVAATLIGLRFQPQETVETSPETVTAPVLAPLTPSDNDDPDAGYIWGLSDTLGTQDVAAPGATLPDDLDLHGALDRFAAATDPAAELEAIAAEASTVAEPAPAGDPCALAEGTPPADCPPGVTGAIFALVTPPEFRVTGQAYPPTEAEYGVRGNPVGPLWCLPSVGLGDTDVPFGILSTVPATFRVLYWPEGHTDRSLSVSAATPDNAAAWVEQLGSAVSASDLPPLQRCVVFPDLEPETAYRAQIIGTSPEGVVRISGAVAFNSSGAPTRPAAEFQVLGQNYVFVRALHPADQRVEVRAFITNPPDGIFGGDEHLTTCPTGPSALSAIAGQVYDVPEAEVIALNAPRDYVKRTARVFRVPEGADVIFCARWLPSGSEITSWERNAPLFETVASFSAPDRILPVLTLDAGGPAPEVGSDIRLVVSTTEGVVCGETDLLVDGAVPRDNPVLCDPSVLATASARERDRRYWSEEFSGDLVLTTTLTKNDGSIETNTAIIPASRSNCFGVCDLPRPQAFGFAVGQPDFDCGSSTPFSLNRTPCRPIAGTEELQLAAVLSWTQGYTNGRTEWHQSEFIDGAVGDLTEFVPQMNTDESFAFTEVDPSTFTGSAELRLETDRPVTYEVRISNPGGGGACQVDPFDAVSSVVSGSSTGVATVTFSDLCRGRIFAAEVMLTDPATGATSVWNSTTLGTRWPGGRSFFVVPGQRIENLNYAWEVTETPEDLVWATAEFRAAREIDRFANTVDDPCSATPDAFEGVGTADTVLGTTSQFRFRFSALSAQVLDSGGCGYFYGRYQSDTAFDIDLYTILRTGEQYTVLHPVPGMTVRVRVWVG